MSKNCRKPKSNSFDYASIDLYDASDPDSIIDYAKRLRGMTFKEVLELGIAPKGKESSEFTAKSYNKGGLGNLLEERYFAYPANNSSEPDFPDAGMELKVTCFDKRKNEDITAGERLVITMIPFDCDIESDFYSSHLWQKCKHILLVYYGRNKSVDKLNQRIEYVDSFTPSDKDLRIILEDYRKISSLILEGKAEELSERQTLYLGACTKGATEETMWVDQFYSPNSKAKKRAFCFKRQYMDYILQNYLSSNDEYIESIVTDDSILKHQTFEEYVINRINSYVGKTDKELCGIFGRDYNNNKAQWIHLSYLMLGVRGEHAEEFIKANITVKAIRVERNGKIRESMSLPPFEFRNLAEEDWEESGLFKYLNESRFLFVVFVKDGNDYVLEGGSFWAMPTRDLELAGNGWRKIKDAISYGVVLTEKADRTGKIIYTNNLPRKGDNPVIHIRPHSKKAAYYFLDGTEVGNTTRDASELPDGRWMTKQSFWLNNNYILAQLENLGFKVMR